MSGINDANQTAGAQEAAAGFCQNCGRPLTAESRRAVGSAVYCEPCLEARLGGVGATGGYRPGFAGGVPVTPGIPNPGLAALLGLIPGVGAMYNEQYAKGIVHLVIFAVLVSFAHVTDVFVLFVLGWIAYMAIEAHHTARARRDGTPLPNPFGLNDIGERMGFGRAWPQGADVSAVVRDAAAAAGFAPGVPPYGAGAASARAGFGAAAGGASGAGSGSTGSTADPAAAAGASWGSPVDAYPAASVATGYTQVPGGQGYAGQGYAGQGYAGQGYQGPGYQGPGYESAGYGPGFGAPATGYNMQNPYGAPFAPPMPPVPPPVSRFPAGAVWLIGLGTIFLLGTTGIFHEFPGLALVGFALIGLGVWNFIRRMTETGLPLEDNGTPMYRLRVVRAVRSSAWLVLLGVLFLLDTFHILQWRYSWPWLIILGGVLMLLNRAAYASVAAPYYGIPGTPPVAGTGSASAASGGTGSMPTASKEPLRDAINDSDMKQGGN